MPNVNDSSVYVRRLGSAIGTTIPDHGSIVEYHNVAEAAESSGFSEKGVQLCCEGHLETLGGYQFEYVAGVPKQTGNHYTPDKPARVRRTGGRRQGYFVDYDSVADAASYYSWSEETIRACCEGTLDGVGGYCFDYIKDEPDGPIVTVCENTYIAYVRIDGNVFACVDDLESCVGSDVIGDRLHMCDIGDDGGRRVERLERLEAGDLSDMRGLSEGYKQELLDRQAKQDVPVVENIVDGLYDWDIQAILDGPDDPISAIESMQGRKVREIATRRVYDDCFHVARCIGCEPWRVHAACTHTLPCTNGYYYRWLDSEDDSDDDTESTAHECRDEFDDCPDFENFPWVW